MLAEPESTPPHRRPPYGIYAYTAREWDPEIGLYYYRARYYAPKIGRFISEDPIGFYGGLNFFAYVGGNPTGYRDPDGYFGPVAIGAAWALYQAGLWTTGALTAIWAGTALAEATGAMDGPEPTRVPVPPAQPPDGGTSAQPRPSPRPVPIPPRADSTTEEEEECDCDDIRRRCADQASGKYPGTQLRRLWVMEYSRCVDLLSHGKCEPL